MFFLPGRLAQRSQVHPGGGGPEPAGIGKWPGQVVVPGSGCPSLFVQSCPRVGAVFRAASRAASHPLPRYYRGQGLLLMARLLQVFEDERRRTTRLDATEAEQFDSVLNTLVYGAMDDLTTAADLLDRWGLIPESYQYGNFHLVPTLMGQGAAYLLSRSPGPAASRIQSARRSFPKDDLFFREFIFAKCWEQGLHRRYGKLLLGDGWAQLRDRLHETFGEPPESQRAPEGYTMEG